MKSTFRLLVCLAVLAGMLPEDGNACTSFLLKDKNGGLFFGKNFDFPAGQGQIHVNLRNLQKTSLVAAAEKPFTWISRYGSISFNQNGREFPYGGMNEAGLVIEQMMHENTEARYPVADGRYGLGELQWIQYQLDVSATVADVIASDRTVRVSFTSVAPLHFLVADAGGHAAVVEYVDGKTVVHTGQGLKYPVLANTTYAVSLALKAKRDAAGAGDFNRFAIAAGMVEAFNRHGGPAREYAFDILQNVAQGGTQWSIVYDVKNRIIHYRTRGNQRIRHAALALFDFSCTAARLFIDIEANANAVSDFKASDSQSNMRLIAAVWNSVEFLKALPQKLRTAYADYSATVTCIPAR